MLTYYNFRVFDELNFYSLTLFSPRLNSIFSFILYFSFKFHKITVKSGVDLASIAKWWRNFSEFQTQKSFKNSKFSAFSRNEQYFSKDSYKKRHVTILNLVWHDN